MSTQTLRHHRDIKGGDHIVTTDKTLRNLARTGAITIKRGTPVEVFDARPAAHSDATIVRLIVGGEARSFAFTGLVACAA